jgi:hypothetical protein
MITTLPLVYAGQQLAAETEFDALDDDVKTLTVLNRARLVQSQLYSTRAMEAAPVGVTPSTHGTRQSRRHRSAH